MVQRFRPPPGKGRPRFRHGCPRARGPKPVCASSAGKWSPRSRPRSGRGSRAGQGSAGGPSAPRQPAPPPPPVPPSAGAALFVSFWQTALETCFCLFVCLLACSFISPVAVWGWCLVSAARAEERSPPAAASPGDGGCGRRAPCRGRPLALPAWAAAGRGGGRSALLKGETTQRRASQVETKRTPPPPQKKKPQNKPHTKSEEAATEKVFSASVFAGFGRPGRHGGAGGK